MVSYARIAENMPVWKYYVKYVVSAYPKYAGVGNELYGESLLYNARSRRNSEVAN